MAITLEDFPVGPLAPNDPGESPYGEKLKLSIEGGINKLVDIVENLQLGTGDMLKANNLGDLDDFQIARDNLNVYSIDQIETQRLDYVFRVGATGVAFADSAYDTGVLAGGMVRNAQGIEIDLRFTATEEPDKTSGSPEWGQGSPLLIKYYAELDFPGPAFVGPGVETSSATGIGKRALGVQLEGIIQYNYDVGLAGTPVAFQTMIQHRNKPGVAINMQPSHSAIMQPWYLADGEVVTLTKPGDGSGDGGVAYIDNTIWGAVNGGELDGSTHGVIPASFQNNVFYTGNVHFDEVRIFNARPPVIAGGAAIGRITAHTVPFLAGFSGAESVGWDNASAYLAPYGFIQPIDDELDQLNPSQEHIAVAPTVSNRVLLSTPQILAPYGKGHRLRVTNASASFSLTFIDDATLAGSGLDLPTGSYTLRPGKTCEFVARTDSGPWILASASVHEAVPSLDVRSKDVTFGKVLINADAVGHQSIAGYANAGVVLGALPTWFLGEIPGGYPLGLHLAAPNSIADVSFVRSGTDKARMIASDGITFDLSIFPSGVAGSIAAGGNLVIGSTTNGTKGLIILQDPAEFQGGYTVFGTPAQGKVVVQATEFGLGNPITLAEFYNVAGDAFASLAIGVNTVGGVTTPQIQFGSPGAAVDVIMKRIAAHAFMIDATDGLSLSGPIRHAELAATPSNPASSAGVVTYHKADKLIHAYNDAGTMRYKYLDMTGTGVTWVHSLTPP